MAEVKLTNLNHLDDDILVGYRIQFFREKYYSKWDKLYLGKVKK